MKIKAVIFDMDGVLIAAKDWHYEALNKALSLFGYEISRSEHLTTFDGLPTWKKLDMLTSEKGLPRGLHDFINQMKQEFTLEAVHTQCKPRFEHEYALSRLKAEGYKLGLASNSIKHSIDTMLGKAALANYFDIILSADDVSYPKPDPEIYTKSIASFGLNPKEVVVVEDNENGIKAATDAKANVLVVEDTSETNYLNIKRFIEKCEGVGL